jgi:hypothetical protein
MTDHIYGRTNLITRNDRPNLFNKEIGLYIDYLKNLLKKTEEAPNEKYVLTFKQNLSNGIAYYQKLTTAIKEEYRSVLKGFNTKLEEYRNELDNIQSLTHK